MELAVRCCLCKALINNVDKHDAIRAWRGVRPLKCLSCSPVSIYTDGTHLATPGPEHVLHTLADAIGLKREWFQNNGSYPHYDLLSNNKRTLAIREGAVRVHDRELVAIMQKAGKGLRSRRSA